MKMLEVGEERRGFGRAAVDMVVWMIFFLLLWFFRDMPSEKQNRDVVGGGVPKIWKRQKSNYKQSELWSVIQQKSVTHIAKNNSPAVRGIQC